MAVALGLPERRRVPTESVFRRLFARLDPEVLDAGRGVGATVTSLVAGRRVIAIDGKTVSDARTAEVSAPRLVAAFDHTAGVVLGQVAVAAKTNEIPTVRTLLKVLDLAGAVLTIDAVHTEDDTAELITPVKGVQTVEVVYVITSADADPGHLVAGHCRWRTSCTTSATCPTPRTPPASAPATHPGSWPPGGHRDQLLRLTGATITAQLRHHDRRPAKIISLLTSDNPTMP